MPLITDKMFTTHQKEIYDHIMRGSLRFHTGFDTHSSRDNSTWDSVKRSSTSFWRDTSIIDMVCINGVWEMKTPPPSTYNDIVRTTVPEFRSTIR